MKNVDSRYSLVVIAAKRARKITEMSENDDGEKIAVKPVTLALKEVAAGKVKYRRIKQGIK